MPASSRGRGAHRFDTQPGGNRLQGGDERRPVGGHGHLRCGVYHEDARLPTELDRAALILTAQLPQASMRGVEGMLEPSP